MFKSLLRTDADYSATVLRLMLGLVFFAHGAQKMLGWFGGGGYSGTMQALGGMGIPSFLIFLLIVTEFFGSIALIIGFLGRVAALGIGTVMVVAVVKVHAANGLFMNWYGAQPGEGFEYHLLVIAVAAALLIKGSGALSVDVALSSR